MNDIIFIAIVAAIALWMWWDTNRLAGAKSILKWSLFAGLALLAYVLYESQSAGHQFLVQMSVCIGLALYYVFRYFEQRFTQIESKLDAVSKYLQRVEIAVDKLERSVRPKEDLSATLKGSNW